MHLRRLCLIALVVYTLALLTATHWPGLAVRGPITRTDLIIHFGAFLVWTVLLGLTGLVGRSVWKVVVAGMLFAVLDETTQPLFRRVYDTLDLLADWAGVLAGAAVLRFVLWPRLAGRPAGAGGRGAGEA